VFDALGYLFTASVSLWAPVAVIHCGLGWIFCACNLHFRSHGPAPPEAVVRHDSCGNFKNRRYAGRRLRPVIPASAAGCRTLHDSVRYFLIAKGSRALRLTRSGRDLVGETYARRTSRPEAGAGESRVRRWRSHFLDDSGLSATLDVRRLGASFFGVPPTATTFIDRPNRINLGQRPDIFQARPVNLIWYIRLGACV